MASGYQGPSAVLAAMAEGIGDLTFASSDWVETAGEVAHHGVITLQLEIAFGAVKFAGIDVDVSPTKTGVPR